MALNQHNTKPSPKAIGCGIFLGIILIILIIAVISLELDANKSMQSTAQTHNSDISFPTNNWDSSHTKKAIDTKGNFEVEISATPIITDSKRVQIQIKTNLPTGTHLMLGVYGEDKCYGQLQVQIPSNQEFVSDAIGPINGLNSGKYYIDVTMPVIGVQPDNLKNIFGEQGRNLTGTLIKENKFGGKTAELHVDFTIGSQEEINIKNNNKLLQNETNQRVKKQAYALFLQLKQFKNSSDFKFYGLGQGGPYAQWVRNCQAIADNTSLPVLLRGHVGDMMQLAREYVSSHGEETNYSKEITKELNQYFNDYDTQR